MHWTGDLVVALAHARRTGAAAGTAVLVEGPSDQGAVQAVASLRGRDLAAEGVVVVPMGGATNIRHFADLLGPRGRGLRLAGLYDAGEEQAVRHGLGQAGVSVADGPAGLAAAAFHACEIDLEDELIRALGTQVVEGLLDDQGELGTFRRFQRQPAQRGRPVHAQLRRFIGTRSGRKIRMAAIMAGALDPVGLPAPLEDLLAQL